MTNKQGLEFTNLVPEQTKFIIDGKEKIYHSVVDHEQFIMVYSGGSLESKSDSMYGSVDFPVKNEIETRQILELYHINSVEKIIN